MRFNNLSNKTVKKKKINYGKEKTFFKSIMYFINASYCPLKRN